MGESRIRVMSLIFPSLPLTCHHLTGSNFPHGDARCAFDTFPNAQPASHDGRGWGIRAAGASASEDGPCPRLSQIISWVATAVLAVCHAPLAVMSPRPPLQNFGQLGAVTEPHHISTKQPVTF